MQGSKPLTLTDLEQTALRFNPTLAQAAAQIDASRAKALQAGLYPNPTIGYQGDLIGVKGPTGASTPGEFQGGFIQQEIVTAGKLRLSRAKYDQEAREAEIAAMGQQLRVLNGVRTRFFELLALQREIELRQDLLKNAEENLRTTREMVNTGLSNEVEVLLTENEVSRAKIELAARQNLYVSHWQHLVALLGNPDLPVSPLAGQLEPDCPALDWDASLGRLLADSPELLAAQAHVVHDQIVVQRERVEPISNITLQAGAGYNFETPGTNAIVQATIKLPVFDKNQGTIRQAQAELWRSQADVQRVALSLRQRLADSFNQYRTALLTSQLYRDTNVPNARKAYEIQLEMYKQRRVAWPEVMKLRAQSPPGALGIYGESSRAEAGRNSDYRFAHGRRSDASHAARSRRPSGNDAQAPLAMAVSDPFLSGGRTSRRERCAGHQFALSGYHLVVNVGRQHPDDCHQPHDGHVPLRRHPACTRVGCELFNLFFRHHRVHAGRLRIARDLVGIHRDVGVHPHWHVCVVLTHGHLPFHDRPAAAGTDAWNHVIHRVMEHVAMHDPVAWIIGDELEFADLRDPDQHVIARDPGRLGNPAAVRAGHPKGVAVQMNGVVIVGAEIQDANAHAISELHNQGRDIRAAASVESEPVEVHARAGRRVGSRLDRKFLRNQREVLVDGGRKGHAGVNDEQANHANGFLHGKMGVIKVRARLMQRDFIDAGLARA